MVGEVELEHALVYSVVEMDRKNRRRRPIIHVEPVKPLKRLEFQ